MKKFKWLTLLSLATPVVAFTSSSCTTKNKDEQESKNKEISIEASANTSVKNLNAEGTINKNDETNKSESLNINDLSLIKTQLDKLTLYNPLYDKSAYEDYFKNLTYQESQFVNNNYTKEDFAKDIQNFKEFYLKVAELNELIKTKTPEEVLKEIQKEMNREESIYENVDGHARLSDISFRAIVNKLSEQYSNIVQETFYKDQKDQRPSENTGNSNSLNEPSKNENVDNNQGSDNQKPSKDNSKEEVNYEPGQKEKNDWVQKFNDLVLKAQILYDKASDEFKQSIKIQKNSAQWQLDSAKKATAQSFLDEKNITKYSNAYSNLENTFKQYATAASLDWNNLNAKSEFYELIEKLQANIDDLTQKVKHILNSQVAKVINDDIKQLTNDKADWENRAKIGQNKNDLARELKKFLEKDGPYYNTYHSSLEQITKYDKERQDRANSIADNTKIFNELVTPEQFSWINRETNMKAFDSITGTLEFAGFGDYFAKSDKNIAYSDIYNDDVKKVIDKYIEKFTKEIKEGRGELDKPSDVNIDEEDLPIFKKLVKISDNYTTFQIERYNKIRKKLHVSELKNITSQLSEEDRANLVLQGILGYTRGIFIKDKTQRNDGTTLKIGHGLNKATDTTLAKIEKGYADNYYGSYNTPVYSSEKAGLTNDFLSTLFFRLILGEREAYDKDLKAKGGNFTVDGWGHLAGMMDGHLYGFYGVPIAIKLGKGISVNDSRIGWRLSMSDMLILPSSSKLQHATEKEGDATSAAEKVEQ